MSGGSPPPPPEPTEEELALLDTQNRVLEQQLQQNAEQHEILKDLIPLYENSLVQEQEFREQELETLRALLPSEELRELNEEVALAQGQRSLAALRGELPVNPFITRAFEDERSNLDDSFRASFGSGFRTSTPYLQSLADLGEREALAEDASRRGDLTTASQLFGASFGQTAGLSLGQSNFNPGQLFGGVQASAGLTGQLGGIGNYAGGIANRLQSDRLGKYQGQLQAYQIQQQSRASLFSALGGIAGAVFGGPLGGSIGTRLFA